MATFDFAKSAPQNRNVLRVNDDELQTVRRDVATIKETLRWHKWLLFGLIAAVISPKFGGPAPPEIVAYVIPLV